MLVTTGQGTRGNFQGCNISIYRNAVIFGENFSLKMAKLLQMQGAGKILGTPGGR